jgi:hypothetical protein
VTMHAPLADRRMGTLVSRLDVSPATLLPPTHNGFPSHTSTPNIEAQLKP